MYIWIVKVGEKLATWLYIDTGMAGRIKKLSRNTLSLVELDDKRIAISFYNKRRECSKRIGLGLNS